MRDLTAGVAVLAGGRAPTDVHEHDVPWMHSPDGAGLFEQLEAIGLL
jgi:hypothetical protein